MIVHGDKRIDQWVASKLNLRPWHDSYSIANVKDDYILGAAIFHNWYPEYGTVEISAASEKRSWLSKAMLKAIADYAFGNLECQCVVLRTPETNYEALSLADRLGFDRYTIPRLRGKKLNEVVCCLTDDDWRAGRYRRLK